MSPSRLLMTACAVALISAPVAAFAQDAAAPATIAAKPVVANADTLTTLKMDGRFTTFIKAVDATNLASLVKYPNLTVFAPTDAAFAAMPAGDLDKLMADKPKLQAFLVHHVINAPITSANFKGKKGLFPSGAGDKILLDGSDEGGALKADGAVIVQSDIKTATGTLHVVDHVLIAGQGDMTMPDQAAPAAPAAPAAH